MCIYTIMYGELGLCFMLFQEKSSGRQAHYKLTSTAMLWLQVKQNLLSLKLFYQGMFLFYSHVPFVLTKMDKCFSFLCFFYEA